MSKQKKGGIINNFRLTLVDDDTHDKLWSRKFTRMGALVTAITTVVVTITVIFCLIAFTPIRTLIPGYPDARTKHDAIQNAIRVDSLQNVIMKWELYSENLRRVVDGQEPLKIDSLMEVRKNVTETVDPKKLAEKDSLLRKEVANEDKFDVKSNSSRSLPIEGMHFFTPLKGVVSQGYDKVLHPYIDITAPGTGIPGTSPPPVSSRARALTFAKKRLLAAKRFSDTNIVNTDIAIVSIDTIINTHFFITQ